MKRILVITYWSIREPLIQNYTLPYLRLIRLFLEEGGRILLLTMEKPEQDLSDEEKECRKAELLDEGVEWVPERYRPFGLRAAWNWSGLIRKWGRKGKEGAFDAVHAWGTPAGAPAHRIAKRSGKPLILDSFEPHAESMLEVGQWKRKGLAFHTLFRLEKAQARAADAVIAVSQGMKYYSWDRYQAVHSSFEVKPACVDGEEVCRKAQQYSTGLPDTEGKVVGVYAGKFGGIYLEKGIFDLIRAAQEEWGHRFLMILLTDLPKEKGRAWMNRKGVNEELVHQEWVDPDRVPSYLALADFAINPVRSVPSKRYCTSIKDGEYWAMGLPVMIPEGVADDAGIIKKERTGVVLHELSYETMRQGMKEMRAILEDENLPAIKERIRSIAEEERGFDRALNAYRKIYGEASYLKKTRTILLVAYYRHNDPVFQSALLDYFKNFPEKERFRFLLLTFEEGREEQQEVEALQKEWLAHEIYWERVCTGRRGGRAGRKVRDLLTGIRKGRRLVREQQVDLVYSEGFPSAIIGHHIASSHSLPHIVHTYEPHAEYMREAGIWSGKSLEYRITQYYEQLLRKEADVLITGTYRMVNEVKAGGGTAEFLRIPSCVDLHHFQYSPSDRTRIREEYGIPEDAFLLVYLGKLGGMYYDQELFQLFAVLREELMEKEPYFLVLTGDPVEEVLGYAQEAGVDKGKLRIEHVSRDQVPAHLSAADLALSGVRQSPSKAYCSPIKHGEYWACGLPILIFRGVSEDDERVENEACGVVIERPDHDAYRQAVREVSALLDEEMGTIRARCRKLAEKERSLERARYLLKSTFEELIPQKENGHK